MDSLLIVILVILVLGFLADLVLDFLNVRHIRPGLPAALEGRYDRNAYESSQAYLKEKSRFGLLVSTAGFIALLVILLAGGFGWLDARVAGFTNNPYAQTLLFFGLLGLVADLAGIPADIYSTFVIEEKYGFNKTTAGTFILDKLKSWLIAVLIGIPVISLILWLYRLTGPWFWIWAWMFISMVSLFITFFYSTLIVPLFNKQEPLPDGELRTAIEELAGRSGFQLSRIYVINGSKRSTRSNAYFAGFGSKRRIVLYDTLIKDLSTEQILSVIAHEIGHYRKRHITGSMVLSILQTGILLFLFSRIAGNPALAHALGVSDPGFAISVLAFGFLYSPVSLLMGLLFNFLSRKFEYQADHFAYELGLGRDLGEALIVLSEKNLSNLTPHPSYVFVHYSHPTLLQRLNKLIS
jgi:STE24 endopeptidase